MKERLWNSEYLKVMVSNMMISTSFYLLMPLLPLYLSEEFNATKDVIGLVLSGYTVTALLSRPFSGFLVDTYPRKVVLLASFALYVACFGGYIAASSMLLFAMVRTLHGAPFGTLSVSNSTVAIDTLPSSRRNEGIGYYGLSNNFGMAVGPTLGVYIYRMSHSFELLFWLSLVVAAAGFAIDSTLRLPHREPEARRSGLSLDRFFLLRGWFLAVCMLLFAFSYGVIYGKEVLGITGGTGTFFMLLAIGLVASRLQGARALRQGRLSHNAAEGIVISLVGYTLFVACPYMWAYYASALLIGLGNGHLWPAFQNMFIEMAHHNERGTANSTLLTAWDAGIGLGVLCGGVVAEHMGYTAAFWASAVVNAVGVGLFMVYGRSFFARAKEKKLKRC